MEGRLNTLSAEATAMKSVSPQAGAKAQAKLDVYTKKRLAAMQVVKDTIENKSMIAELLG